eukprot:5424626-Amphidinium_carterae.1
MIGVANGAIDHNSSLCRGWVPGRVGENVIGERQCKTNTLANKLWRRRAQREPPPHFRLGGPLHVVGSCFASANQPRNLPLLSTSTESLSSSPGLNALQVHDVSPCFGGNKGCAPLSGKQALLVGRGVPWDCVAVCLSTCAL